MNIQASTTLVDFKSPSTFRQLKNVFLGLADFWHIDQSKRGKAPQARAMSLSGLVEQAASIASCAIEYSDQALASYDNLQLPLLVFLDYEQEGDSRRRMEACLLLEKTLHGNYKVIRGETGDLVEIHRGLIERAAVAGNYQVSLNPSTNDESELEDHWFVSALKVCRKEYLHAGIATLIVNCFALLVPLAIMVIYDQVMPDVLLQTLFVLDIGVLIVAASDFSLRMLRGYAVDAASKRIDVLLGLRIFNRLFGAELGAVKNQSSMTAVKFQELTTLRQFLSAGSLVILGDLPFLILFLGAMFWAAGSLVLVPLVSLLLVIGLAVAFQAPHFSGSQKRLIERNRATGKIHELMNGYATIKANGSQAWAQQQWKQSGVQASKSDFANRLFSQISSHIAIVAQAVATIFVLLFGVLAIAKGDLTMGALFAAVILNGRILAPLVQMVDAINRFSSVKAAYEHLDDILSLAQEDKHLNTSLAYFSGEVALKNVSFSYSSNERAMPSKAIIQDVSLKVKPNTRMAIVGPIGAGKSTLLKLILKLYQADVGAVEFDGVDAGRIDSTYLRSKIGYVPQDPHFFIGSVKDNILLGLDVDDREVMRAVNISGVCDWLSKCRGGLDFAIEENAKNLSQGQRQSLALARAIVKNPKLLLLDEPTSLLDRKSEQNFIRQLENVPDTTVLLVTHSPAVLEQMDEIAVLDQGRVQVIGPSQFVLPQLVAQKTPEVEAG